MKSSTDLDIVLPCYNPKNEWVEQIISSVKEIGEHLPAVSIGIILVNDGSPVPPLGLQLEILESNLSRFIYVQLPENKGKGAAVRAGVEKATAPIIIYTDYDFPYTTASLVDVYQSLLQNEGDVVIGARDKSYFQQIPASRRWISDTLKNLIRFGLSLPTSDTQAGLKGFNQVGKKLFLTTTIDRYLFDLEFIALVVRNKSLKLHLQPVILRPDVEFSKMGGGVLLNESFNFVRIFLKRYF